MNDINERAKEAWKDDTTGRERVKQVIQQTTEPTKAGTIARRALVSEPTAREYCNEFVDEGLAVSTQDGRTTRYRRNEQHLVDQRIRELRTERTRQELVDSIRDMKARIERYRDEYGVESPEDLVVELDTGDEGWADVGRWRSTRQNLAIAKAALQVEQAHRIAEA